MTRLCTSRILRRWVEHNICLEIDGWPKLHSVLKIHVKSELQIEPQLELAFGFKVSLKFEPKIELQFKLDLLLTFHVKCQLEA